MSIILFFLVLFVLVMVHEFGHFIAAKISKMRVEEFAFGFPPKIWGKKIGETLYAFNLLPIGGYVKITGEALDSEEVKKNNEDPKSFQNRPKILQIFVLSAGVLMNLILAISIFYFINIRTEFVDSSQISLDGNVQPKLYVNNVIANSAADKLELKAGDEIISITVDKKKYNILNTNSTISFLKENYEKNISLLVKDLNGVEKELVLKADYIRDKDNNIQGNSKSFGIGLIYGAHIEMTKQEALSKAFSDTYIYTKETFKGLISIVGKALNGVNPLSDLSGPVGIAKMVGSASQSGLDYFLFFVAILSVNLAVFNMLPIPALDGGRIIFVLFEAISRRKINTKVSYYLNLIGFVSLIVLLIATTISDIMR